MEFPFDNSVASAFVRATLPPEKVHVSKFANDAWATCCGARPFALNTWTTGTCLIGSGKIKLGQHSDLLSGEALGIRTIFQTKYYLEISDGSKDYGRKGRICWRGWENSCIPSTDESAPQQGDLLLGQRHSEMGRNIPIWKTTTKLQLRDDMSAQWNSILSSLRAHGIFRSADKDSHMERSGWLLNSEGCPTKIIIFAWLVFHNRNLTWEDLQKRNWHGPAICPLCMENTENNLHLFLTCTQVQPIWQNLATHYGLTLCSFLSISEAFKRWSSMNKERRAIPLLAIWKWRNAKIFSSKAKENSSVVVSIISLFNALELSGKNRNRNGRNHMTTMTRNRNERRPSAMTTTVFPCAFFDGPAQHGICACGVYIRTTNDQAIKIYWNAGPGSNNKAEAVALA